jgi:hypothetical protein
MSPDSFWFLEKVVSAQLQNQDTNFKLAISPTEKLLITVSEYNYDECHFVTGL